MPNIVIFLSEDQGWPDYGCMGYPHIQAPNLDELARRGAFFPRSHVPRRTRWRTFTQQSAFILVQGIGNCEQARIEQY